MTTAPTPQMSEQMVDHAARAIYEESCQIAQEEDRSNCLCPHAERYRRLARAALNSTPPAQDINSRVQELESALRAAGELVDGLFCMGCKKQGAEMDARCCKDADCDAGWYGIDAKGVRNILTETARLLPGFADHLRTRMPRKPEVNPHPVEHQEKPRDRYFAILAEKVLAEAKAQRDEIGDSDLDDEQPVTLTVHTTLGDIRKARRWAR